MTKDRQKTRRGPAWVVAVGVALVAALVIVACGGDDDEESEDDVSSTTTAEPSSTTTQPPGTELAAVEPIVVDLLERKDEVTERALRDPAQVLDENAAIREELAEIFAPDEYDARLVVYQDNAANEVVFEPYNSDHIQASTLMGDLSTVDEDTVQGVVCTVYHYRTNGPTGGELKDGVAHPSRVTVVRLDGVWLIQQIDENSSQVCDPGASA
jgi:hypothetical protein